MGHSLLQDVPKTRPWKEVVGLIQGGGSAPQVARAVMEAAKDGLANAETSKGLIEATYLLMQLPIAARSSNPAEALRQAGIPVGDGFDMPSLLAGLATAMRDAFPRNQGKDDVGEIARRALHTTVGNLLAARADRLDGITHASIVEELGKMSTEKQFGIVGKSFFGKFMDGYVGQYVDRVLMREVGQDRRFNTLERADNFGDAVSTHCGEMAVLFKDYSGGWFMKHKHENEGVINREHVRGFIWKAMDKMRSEFDIEAGRSHGND